MTRTTAACPEGMIDETNALLAEYSGNEADAKTFGVAAWSDIDGNLYSVASGDFVVLLVPSLRTTQDTTASPTAVACVTGEDVSAALLTLQVTQLFATQL